MDKFAFALNQVISWDRIICHFYPNCIELFNFDFPVIIQNSLDWKWFEVFDHLLETGKAFLNTPRHWMFMDVRWRFSYRDIPGNPIKCTFEGQLKDLFQGFKPKQIKKMYYQQVLFQVCSISISCCLLLFFLFFFIYFFFIFIFLFFIFFLCHYFFRNLKLTTLV